MMKLALREIFVLILALIVPVAGYVLVYVPSSVQQRQLRADIRMNQRGLADLAAAARSARELDCKAALVRAQIARFADSLTCEESQSRITDEVARTARQNHLNVQHVELLKRQRLVICTEQGVRLHLNGDCADLYNFLQQMETGAPAARLTQLSIHALGEDGTVRADLTLCLYFSPRPGGAAHNPDGFDTTGSKRRMKKRPCDSKSLESRASNVLLGVIAIVAVGIQVFRFAQIGPVLAAISAASDSDGDSTSTLRRDNGPVFAAVDLAQYQQIMQHTEQVVDTFKSFPTTRPAQREGLKVNPFKATRALGLSVDRTEQERSDTIAAAQEMTLESIMPSNLAPVCLINNVLLRENQQLNGFTVDRIKSDSVLIHRGNYHFELRLVKQ